jgi:hypothetical protein
VAVIGFPSGTFTPSIPFQASSALVMASLNIAESLIFEIMAEGNKQASALIALHLVKREK